MAGDWIPMRLDLNEDPAVLEMADILGQPEEYIVGALHRIWSWASRNCHSGKVTGVTLLSLGRATGNGQIVQAMVQVGWLAEERDADNRPVIIFPKWENWLSESAKKRLNNSRNKRNSRANKQSDQVQGGKNGHTSVTDLSSFESDKKVTTVQESTVQKNKNTHTHTAPAWLQKDWQRWCDFREAMDGRPMDAISAEAILMDLMRRGDGKAQRDIDFSIQKRAKSICDSDNDWAKNRNNGPTGSGRRYGKETAEEARIRKEAENPPDPEVAKRIKALEEEMWKNGGK